MIDGTLTDYQRDDLLVVAHYWTRKISKQDLRKIEKDIFRCFDKRKIKQEKKAGDIDVRTRIVNALMDQSFHNEISTAFECWIETYGPFQDLLDRHGFNEVFALCGLLAAKRKNARAESLIQLSGFLSKALVRHADEESSTAKEFGEAYYQQRRQQNRTLETARWISAQKRSEKARELDRQVRKIAFEYFQHHPDKSLNDAISYIRKNNVILSAATIRDKIKGVKAEALRSLNTDTPG